MLTALSRRDVIALFGAALALNGADTPTIGAVAPQLERSLHIGNTEIGLLMGLVRVVRYTLEVPNNALLIVGSALGYFFFSGLQTFGLLFVRGRYHTGQATAELVLALRARTIYPRDVATAAASQERVAR